MAPRWVALAACLLAAACATAPRGRGLLPDPALERAPVPLSPKQKKAAQKAWALADAGDLAGARAKLAGLPGEHPVRVFLELEIAWAAGEGALWGPVAGFAARYPDYPPAWELAVLVGEREGELLPAADAARRLASLTGQSRWQKKADELVSRYLALAEREVAGRLERGEAAEALARARGVLERFPERRGLREMAVRAALAAGKPDEAQLLVLSLPEDPAGLQLKAEVAAAQGRWEVAAELFRRLPAGVPDRCQKLRQAEERARWHKAPPRVAQAASSSRLSRAELATLLLFYFPRIAEKASGVAPLFEDLVGHPAQEAVLVVVRAGVMSGDPLTRRFGPGRGVTPKELESVLQRLVKVLGLAPCPEEGGSLGCLAFPAGEKPLTGRETVSLLAAFWEKLPC